MAGQKTTDRRLWWLLGAAALMSMVWLMLTIGLLGLTLEDDARQTVWGLLGDRLMLVVLTWAAGMAAIAYGLKRWFDHWITPSVQLAEEAQVLLQTDVVRELPLKGNVETRVPDAAFDAAGVEAQGELWAAMLDTKQSWDDLIRLHAPDAATRDAIRCTRTSPASSSRATTTSRWSVCTRSTTRAATT